MGAKPPSDDAPARARVKYHTDRMADLITQVPHKAKALQLAAQLRELIAAHHDLTQEEVARANQAGVNQSASLLVPGPDGWRPNEP